MYIKHTDQNSFPFYNYTYAHCIATVLVSFKPAQKINIIFIYLYIKQYTLNNQMLMACIKTC